MCLWLNFVVTPGVAWAAWTVFQIRWWEIGGVWAERKRSGPGRNASGACWAWIWGSRDRSSGPCSRWSRRTSTRWCWIGIDEGLRIDRGEVWRLVRFGELGGICSAGCGRVWIGSSCSFRTSRLETGRLSRLGVWGGWWWWCWWNRLVGLRRGIWDGRFWLWFELDEWWSCCCRCFGPNRDGLNNLKKII